MSVHFVGMDISKYKHDCCTSCNLQGHYNTGVLEFATDFNGDYCFRCCDNGFSKVHLMRITMPVATIPVFAALMEVL